MKPRDRRGLLYALLAVSLLLNVAMIASLASSGGLRRIAMKFNLVEASSQRAGFMEADEARFRKFPNRPGDIFFAGDSLIAAGPWAEFYSPIRTRGIGGEQTKGLLGRLDEVIEDQPRKLFLLIGANDLASAVPQVQLLANYRTMLTRIQAESPKTIVYAISVLPVNLDFSNAPTYTSAQVREVNGKLKALVGEFPNARFVDVTDLLTDDKGDLRLAFTNDGLHLTVDGYLALRERLQEFVLKDEAPKTPHQEPPQP